MRVAPLHALPFALAATALVSPVQAQLTVTPSGGIVGKDLTYLIEGPAFELYAWLPSLLNTPTPLAPFDGGNPLVLDIDLFTLTLPLLPVLTGAPFTSFLGGTGTAGFSLPGFPDPTLQGVPFHVQVIGLNFPATPFLIDSKSNLASTVLSIPGDAHTTLSDNLVARQGHTLTALTDGSVLITGGDEPDGGGNLTPIASMELYDPASMTFGPTAGALSTERSTHTATLLNDGRVLLLGGYDVASNPDVLDTGEIYDPVTQTTSPIAPMGSSAPPGQTRERTQHIAVTLPDDRVFVAGGVQKFEIENAITVLDSAATAMRSTQLYDPGTNTWSEGPDLPERLFGHTASLLNDGTVLICGGVEITFLLFIPVPTVTDRCLIYDPGSNSLTEVSSMFSSRVYHGQVTLPNGDVSIVGGVESFDLQTASFDILATTERFTPAPVLVPGSGTWSPAGSLTAKRAYPNVVAIGDDVVVLGGLDAVDITTGTGTPVPLIESAPGPSLVPFTAAGTMTLPREIARSVAIEGGDRILTVGTGDNGVPAVDRSAEIFVP